MVCRYKPNTDRRSVYPHCAPLCFSSICLFTFGLILGQTIPTLHLFGSHHSPWRQSGDIVVGDGKGRRGWDISPANLLGRHWHHEVSSRGLVHTHRIAVPRYLLFVSYRHSTQLVSKILEESSLSSPSEEAFYYHQLPNLSQMVLKEMPENKVPLIKVS